jgi:hypothetical protein
MTPDDPRHPFLAKLIQLKAESGLSYWTLEKQVPCSRSTLHAKLNGNSPLDWKIVEPLIRACYAASRHRLDLGPW